MNTKRNHPESVELVAKKAKFMDELSSDQISEPEKDTFQAQCQKIDEDREVQSHGESTFRATTEINGDADSELNDLGIECFDDFDLSDEENRQPVAGPMGWIQRHIDLGTDPWHILQELLPPNIVLPPNMDMFTMWGLIFDLLDQPKPRHKLPHINTLDQVLDLFKTCRNILVLTGAGVSVSCGIPDFRSRDGIYARLNKEYPDLPDPQAMFDIEYFRSNTKPFYKFAKEIYPGKFRPSLSHRFINQLEKNEKLLRNYTQNIDTLERVAGITRVIECHGSFSTASCTNCKYNTTSDTIRDDILNQVTPMCPKCPFSEDTLSVMKPDIVFFGERLPQTFYDSFKQDMDEVDLLIVIGSSLKVRPVNLVPNQIPANVPQILINREPLAHLNFDVELLGDCDTIIAHMCEQLGESWCEVLEDFEIPNVSQEFLMPSLQTPPNSPVKHDGTVHDDSLEKTHSSSKELIKNDNSQDESQNKDKDVPHIFLPPCRYIFHGAEIGQGDSMLHFEDDDEDSDKSDCSSETTDNIEEANYDGHNIANEKNYKDNYEETLKKGPEFSEEKQCSSIANAHDSFSPAIKE